MFFSSIKYQLQWVAIALAFIPWGYGLRIASYIPIPAVQRYMSAQKQYHDYEDSVMTHIRSHTIRYASFIDLFIYTGTFGTLLSQGARPRRIGEEGQLAGGYPAAGEPS